MRQGKWFGLALVLAAGKDNPAALALAAYLKSDKARGIARAYGYEFPQ